MKTYQDIPIESLIVDHHYQRELDGRRVEIIKVAYDARLFGTPIVSVRPDGTFPIIDGQHRVEGLRRTGFKDSVHCEVLSGLTIHEEAEMFVRVNNGRSPIKAFDAYKAKLVALDPTTLEIDKIVRSFKLRVMKDPGKNRVRAVKELERAHGHQVLSQTLGVLTGWAGSPVEASYVDRPYIAAFAAFLHAYPTACFDDLVQRLRKSTETRTPAKVLHAINFKRDTHLCSYSDAAVLVIRDIYNKGRRKDLLLPAEKKAA